MSSKYLLLVVLVTLFFLPPSSAFGAGNIPSFSFLESKAFRHGDIEDTLGTIIKRSGGFLGRSTSKFVARIYFGNWLRDYSQAMDIAGLTKLSCQSILNLVMALGFLSNGYATGEFEVTKERLGVYSCCEHIDNPKGYAADQPNGDARNVDSRLRGPVRSIELAVDPRTGMKNYIANESGDWDTSSKLVRNRIRECILLGRRARNNNSESDLYESYRLLGSLLHTLEDFSAHSNWCELSLLRLGYSNVFCHTGSQALISTPAGLTPPLVTGTFGGSDFIHSLIGETSDHISEASVSDLATAMGNAKISQDNSNNRSGITDSLRGFLLKLPNGSGNDLSREMNSVNEIRTRDNNGNELSPQELHAALWKILTFRDNVVKTIEKTTERIPGMSALVEKCTTAVNKFVFTTLEPLIKPIMINASAALGQRSSAVIASNLEQFEVFDNPYATDPTHSFLSKDHFELILNEPAGKVAIIIVEHTVKAIVAAWESELIDPDSVANEVLTAFHHPYFYDNNSSIQREMGSYLKEWIETQQPDDKAYILNALTKESVRAGRNKRRGHLETRQAQPSGQFVPPSTFPQQVNSREVVPQGTYMPPIGPPPNQYGQRESNLSSYGESSFVPAASFPDTYAPPNYPPPPQQPSFYQSQEYIQPTDTQYYRNQQPSMQQENQFPSNSNSGRGYDVQYWPTPY